MSEPAADPTGEPPRKTGPVPPVRARPYSPPPRLRRYLRRLPALPDSGALRDPH